MRIGRDRSGFHGNNSGAKGGYRQYRPAPVPTRPLLEFVLDTISSDGPSPEAGVRALEVDRKDCEQCNAEK
jgi:hypothetical protein